MIIYLDIVLILNFLVNFLFLCIIQIMFKEKVKYHRLLIASLVGIIVIIAFLFDLFFYNLFKIFGGIIICLIAFPVFDFRKLILKTTSFYLVNFSFVGMLSSFQIKKIVFLSFTLGLLLFLIIIENNKKYFIFKANFSYNVSVLFEDFKVKTIGFLDTGNFAVYKELPIVFLDNKFFTSKLKNPVQIYVETIKGKELIEGYKANIIVFIKNKKVEREVLVSFTKLNSSLSCLLNSLMFT